MQYSDDDLLAEIRAVAAQCDGTDTPSLQQFREHGSMAATTVTRRFGSWQAAVEKAGFEPHSPTQSISKQALLEELHRVADELGTVPTGEQFNAKGCYSVSAYQTQFGSWTAALTAAFGDDATATTKRHSRDALLTELRRVAEEYGSPPRFRDMDAHGQYAARTYVDRFGSWNDAVVEAGFEPRSSGTLTDAALLADLQRLRTELGSRPTPQDVRDHGSHAVATYQRRFGSWSDAITAAFDENDASASEADAADVDTK